MVAYAICQWVRHPGNRVVRANGIGRDCNTVSSNPTRVPIVVVRCWRSVIGPPPCELVRAPHHRAHIPALTGGACVRGGGGGSMLQPRDWSAPRCHDSCMTTRMTITQLWYGTALTERKSMSGSGGRPFGVVVCITGFVHTITAVGLAIGAGARLSPDSSMSYAMQDGPE